MQIMDQAIFYDNWVSHLANFHELLLRYGIHSGHQLVHALTRGRLDHPHFASRMQVSYPGQPHAWPHPSLYGCLRSSNLADGGNSLRLGGSTIQFGILCGHPVGKGEGLGMRVKFFKFRPLVYRRHSLLRILGNSKKKGGATMQITLTAKLVRWASIRIYRHALPGMWILLFSRLLLVLPVRSRAVSCELKAKMATPDVKSEEKQKLMDGEETSAAKKSDKKDGTRWAWFLDQLCMLAPSTGHANAVEYIKVCVQLKVSTGSFAFI